MKVIRGLSSLNKFSQACVATIGNFDGVHLGHQAVLSQLDKNAKALNLPSVVIIFEPQPQEFFRQNEAPARISRFSEKLVQLDVCHLDYVLCLNFNSLLANLSADQFIADILLDGLNISHLIVGDDFRFGKQRAGNFDTLRHAGHHNGFTVENTQTLKVAGERVSSTRVRSALENGDFKQVENLLGRPYSMTGRVIHGEKLGRSLGFPTANIPVRRKKSPLQGVFSVRLQCEAGNIYTGAASIGTRPTVNGKNMLLEVHIFDFDGDLYSQRVKVSFCQKIRDEAHFDNLDTLKARIQQDISIARDYFGS